MPAVPSLLVPFPESIAVRISSEAAGAISMTPVVNRTMPARELVEVILATTGKDRGRVSDVLARGAVVQGASRFRWPGLNVEATELDALLATFPDPDPRRPFRRDACIGVRLRAGAQALELPREVASRRRFLKRRSLWDALMELADVRPPKYIDYSYRTRSDDYRLPLANAEAEAIREAAGLLAYSGLAAHVRGVAIDCIEYSVRFP
jgi:hypothetical protein